MADFMKTFRLTIVVVVSALFLATANAMPDLGRETGKFIRSDEPTPKDVRTFEPAKKEPAEASSSFLAPVRPTTNLSFLAPVRPTTNLSFLAPVRPTTNLSFLAPVRPTVSLSFLSPFRPPVSLDFLASWRYEGNGVAL